MHCHSDEDVVVSCGLDRFVRIHDINNRKLLNKVSVWPMIIISEAGS